MSIMNTHEEFCEALKTEVLRYSLEELHDGFKQTSARKNCADYAEIYKIEIDRRKP